MAYNPDIAKRPQVIAANKIDAIYDEENNPVDAIKKEFEPKGIAVYPISAVSGKGVKELLYHVNEMLEGLSDEVTVFEQEYFPDLAAFQNSEEPYSVAYDEEADEYVVEANSSYAYIPVLLYRQPEMKTDTVTLGLKLVANDYFSLTFDEFDKMDKFTNGSVVYDSFDATMHKICMTDIMPKPKQWSAFEFGTFTPKKLNLICQYFGYTYDDFQNDKKITYLQQTVISRKFSEVLNKAYHDGSPILEDNGQLMWVKGCVYGQGSYPEGNK